MSVKNQNPSLCKLLSVYEGIPEESFDEFDVDSNFSHKIFDISQPSTEKYVLAKAPTKILSHASCSKSAI